MSSESPVSPESRLEQELRSKPSFAAAKAEYEAAMRQMADRITALTPRLTWRLDDNSWEGCGAEYAGTRGRQVYQRIVFDGPIPDDTWPQALQIVKDGAARLGAADLRVVQDRPDDHDVYLTGPDGIEFRFGTQVNAVLSAKSDCRIADR